ncbi:pyruvate, water dikinase regulatory protein [Sunxiuqinia sp. A32]|uniref:pyruvate, water dikinase regulatory protein n=1 Tax=Sunxiuqinia sp. A32 TaxID=3461496 RepID=UPI00404585B4
MDNQTPKKPTKPIYVVSGGKGLAGNNMVQSLLIQYPNNNVPVIIVPNVISEDEIEKVILKAKKNGGLVTHTMVIPSLRKRLIELANQHEVKQIDFMGELASHLDGELGISSLESPGLFREINQQYFNRIDAIEFTLRQDDGMSPERLNNAEIILCGVSRAGKTPLSVYLAMYGWKVANVPLVNGIKPPRELFEVDPQRVFGLHIGLQHLIAHRIKRLKSFNNMDNTLYIDERKVREEIRNANFIFERGGFTVIHVSNKPIESTANEVLNIMNDRFDYGGRKIVSPYKDSEVTGFEDNIGQSPGQGF